MDWGQSTLTSTWLCETSGVGTSSGSEEAWIGHNLQSSKHFTEFTDFMVWKLTHLAWGAPCGLAGPGTRHVALLAGSHHPRHLLGWTSHLSVRNVLDFQRSPNHAPWCWWRRRPSARPPRPWWRQWGRRCGWSNRTPQRRERCRQSCPPPVGWSGSSGRRQKTPWNEQKDI